jgi:hypothetical protein
MIFFEFATLLITIKTQNTKCRLYWCLIELTDWRYSTASWYFRLAKVPL